MIEAAASLGLVAFLLTSIGVGGRLVWLWRRTRGLPELLVGLGFLIGGVVGFVPEHLVLRGVIASPWDGPVLVMSNLAVRTTAMLCAVFTWHVFRRADPWALAILVVLGVLLGVSFVGFPGPWARAQTDAEWTWSVVTAVVRSLAFLWAAAESLRQASLARRRAALGLVFPDVARRYLLWGVAMAGPACMSAIPLLNRWLLLPHAGPDLAWMLLQSGLGLVAAAGMGAAFLAPGGRASAQQHA
ncbi:MAG: hypothetical protein CL910_18385 [Deltaproteobacteria bacterium]|nr:hypothetical protein [Deltaproteobacteria bacterium]